MRAAPTRDTTQARREEKRREETQEQQQRITPAVTSADPYITNAEGRAQFEMLTKGTSTQRKNLSEEGWNNRAGGRATRYLGEHAPSSFSLSLSPLRLSMMMMEDTRVGGWWNSNALAQQPPKKKKKRGLRKWVSNGSRRRRRHQVLTKKGKKWGKKKTCLSSRSACNAPRDIPKRVRNLPCSSTMPP